MKIKLRNKFTFNVLDIVEKHDFHNGKYQNVLYIKGYSIELKLYNRTVVLSDTEFRNRIII